MSAYWGLRIQRCSCFTHSFQLLCAGLSPLVGVTGGVDTFVSQTHGAAQHALIGITLQRALLVAISACIPILALYTQAERLLRALGQEADLAAAAARYIALYSPLLPLHAAILCLYRCGVLRAWSSLRWGALRIW